MITSKIKTRYWVLLILFVGALVLSLVSLASSMGEQYHVMAEEFRLVFRLSILVSIILLIIGTKCFGRWRRRQQQKQIWKSQSRTKRIDQNTEETSVLDLMYIRKKKKRIRVQWIGVLSSLRLYMAVATVSRTSRSSIDVHVGNSGIGVISGQLS